MFKIVFDTVYHLFFMIIFSPIDKLMNLAPDIPKLFVEFLIQFIYLSPQASEQFEYYSVKSGNRNKKSQ